MFRRSAVSLGFFSVLAEELTKLPSFLAYKTKESSHKTVDAASKTVEFLKGEDPGADAKKVEWQKKHKEAYHAILAQQQAQAAELQAKEKARRAHLSLAEKLKLSVADLTSALSEMTSMKAGAMSLLQHCTASHAAEVAIEQGIDVKNVQMVLEKQAKKDGIGYEEVVVGYIDAPSASEEEVMVFAEKLQKACPVASQMHVEWRQRDAAPTRGSDDEWRRKDDGSVGFEAFSQGKMPVSPSASTTAAPQSSHEATVPRGMPGGRRMHSTSSSLGRGLGGDDDLHLPGVKKRHAQASHSPAQEEAAQDVSGRHATDARKP